MPKKQPTTNTTDATNKVSEDINTIGIDTYAKQAYLDYAMSVVCGRAIPYLEDGQKPVQRRTLYAMSEMRLAPDSKPVKSAKIVGTVLGSYHPHGDQSVYNSMVRQAQSFVMRYPLVHGEGNFGSRDGDGAAAMRYCFTGDTLISTEFGLIRIDQIPLKIGVCAKKEIHTNFLVSSFHKVGKATKWLFSGYHQTITIKSNHASVTCTVNEPFYVYERSGNTSHFVWKRADQLKEQDRLAISLDSSKYLNIPSGKPLPVLLHPFFGEVLTQDVILFFAHLFSSHFRVQKDVYHCNYNLTDTYAEHTQVLSKKAPLDTINFSTFELLTHQSLINILNALSIQYSITEPSSNYEPYTISLIDKQLVAALQSLNTGIDCSRIPDFIFEASRDEIQQFILRWLAIDSQWPKLMSFDDLIANLKISTNNESNSNFYGKLCLHTIDHIQQRYIQALGFYVGIPFSMLNNSPNLFLENLNDYGKSANIIDGYFITNITQCDKDLKYSSSLKPVYDLTVDDTHAFVANGFIAHNTEAKLSVNSKYLLQDINSNTVDFRQNYDGTAEEPDILPARLPFILMNGAEGVGVGMACSIPPHRAAEVTQAAITLLKNPKATFEDVMANIHGPDFPTGGQLIQSREKILSIYKEGNGTLKLRGRWEIETGARGTAWKLIVKELPYGTSSQKLMEQIDALLNPKPKVNGNKKEFTIEQLRLKQLFGSMIDVYRDESGKEHTVRVVFEPKTSKQNPQDLVDALLTYTSLQDTIKLNFVMVGRDRRPACKGILSILTEWNESRVEITKRRLEYEQKVAERRLHLADGRLKIFADIQEAIKIIQSSDDPKTALMARFAISEVQVNDVLEMRLRQLARLEGATLVKEKGELEKTIIKLKRLLSKKNELIALVIEELESDLKSLGEDPRLTLIEEVTDADEPVLSKSKSMFRAPEENVTVALSDKFWVRSKIGLNQPVEGFIFKTGDFVSRLFNSTTYQTLFALDHTGRVYSVDVSSIPSGRGGDGLPLASVWELQGKLKQAWTGQNSDKYILVSSQAQGFVVNSSDLQTRMKAGKAVLTVSNDAYPLAPINVTQASTDATVVCLSSDGSVVAFPLSDLPVMSKGKGVGFMGLRNNCELISVIVCNERIFGLVENGNGNTKWISGEEFNSVFGARSASRKGRKFLKADQMSLIAKL